MAEYGSSPRWDFRDPEFIEDNGSFLTKAAWESSADEHLEEVISSEIEHGSDIAERVRAIVGHSIAKHGYGVSDDSRNPRSDVDDVRKLKPTGKIDFAEETQVDEEYKDDLDQYTQDRQRSIESNLSRDEAAKRKNAGQEFIDNNLFPKGSPGNGFIGIHNRTVDVLRDPSQVLEIRDSNGKLIKTIVAKLHDNPKPKIYNAKTKAEEDASATVVIIHHDIEIDNPDRTPCGTTHRVIRKEYVDELFDVEAKRAREQGQSITVKIDLDRPSPDSTAPQNDAEIDANTVSADNGMQGGSSPMSSDESETRLADAKVALSFIDRELATEIVGTIQNNIEEISGVDENTQASLEELINVIDIDGMPRTNRPASGVRLLSLQDGEKLAHAFLAAATTATMPIVETDSLAIFDPNVEAVKVASSLRHEIARTRTLDEILDAAIPSVDRDGRTVRTIFNWEEQLENGETPDLEDPLRVALENFYSNLSDTDASKFRSLMIDLDLALVGTMVGTVALAKPLRQGAFLGPVRGISPVDISSEQARAENLDKALTDLHDSEVRDLAIHERAVLFAEGISRTLGPDDLGPR